MRILTATISLFLVSISAFSGAHAEGDAAEGAKIYRNCVACHALEPGLHLSGPSLDGVFGRTAGTAPGFSRFSPGLEEADFEWDAASLNAWLENPVQMIPDTFMTFKGIEEAQARDDLVAFLRIAGQPDGGNRAVAQGLMPESWLRAGAPQPLRGAPPANRVSTISHCGDSYRIETEDGRQIAYWEKNVRLKVDSVDTGPPKGVPVLLGASMRGDRVSVIFQSLADLKTLVEEKC